MAGTTVSDTFSVHDSMIKAFQDHELIINREIASKVLAVPKPIGISTILNDNFGWVNESLVESIHTAFKKHMNLYYLESDLVKETQQTSLFFEQLKDKGIKIVLDTGFTAETAKIIVKRLNWETTIDGLVCSDDPSIGRPKPDMIYKAMEMTGVADVKYVMKVGDTPNDMLQGKNAQCLWTIGVNSGAFTIDELENAGADFIVDNPFEILNINEYAL
jgi:phosphonatase-like hydrolase